MACSNCDMGMSMRPAMGAAGCGRMQSPAISQGENMTMVNPAMSPSGMNMGGILSCPVPNPGADMGEAALMKQINESSFAMDDVLLFLDTHPNDPDAMRYYHNVVGMRKNVVSAYERQYGPLTVDSVTGNTWSWMTQTWPWEGGCN